MLAEQALYTSISLPYWVQASVKDREGTIRAKWYRQEDYQHNRLRAK